MKTLKIYHNNLQEGYDISCKLHKGKYKYVLSFDGEEVYYFIDKYLPEDLPKNGKINRMLNKLSKVKNIGTKEGIRELKYDVYENIINDLEIDLSEDEYVFDNFHQTNGHLYNYKDTVLFHFMVKSVEKYQNGIYKITFILTNNEFLILEDTIDGIIFELLDRNLILINYSNYKNIFMTLINIVLMG